MWHNSEQLPCGCDWRSHDGGDEHGQRQHTRTAGSGVGKGVLACTYTHLNTAQLSPPLGNTRLCRLLSAVRAKAGSPEFHFSNNEARGWYWQSSIPAPSVNSWAL